MISKKGLKLARSEINKMNFQQYMVNKRKGIRDREFTHLTFQLRRGESFFRIFE